MIPQLTRHKKWRVTPFQLVIGIVGFLIVVHNSIGNDIAVIVKFPEYMALRPPDCAGGRRFISPEAPAKPAYLPVNILRMSGADPIDQFLCRPRVIIMFHRSKLYNALIRIVKLPAFRPLFPLPPANTPRISRGP